MMVFTMAAHADAERWKRQGWNTNFDKSSIRFIEILSGGPPKDGIPSIDNPIFETASAITNIGPQEPVIRVAVGDDIRAYPISVLTWHEIVNDVVGGKPVAITYCPLCNSALVFERQVGDQLLDFGTTGKLRNSDLVMYDRQSESWWQQFTGEAIVGDMLGTKLTMVPVRVESFERFLNATPNGKVLVPNNPSMRRYGQNPYVTYDSRAMPYPLFVGKLPDDIGPMVRVVVVKNGDVPIASTLTHLREQSMVRLGDVELRWEAGQNSSLDSAVIAKGRDVGNVVAHAVKADGSLGDEVVYDVTFAFAFRAFHPDAEIVQN
ncbi:MAG: hypothetical protein COA52_02290 [Hyphomicrobiales bacterium]|nr:DUF3179 domain-containing protein [Hyphomicrobiales bacterium]PCJ96200.1 MAG: hypothetical protein COA52_02290 [Hyphomicrobiales bacterium]